MKAIEEDPAAGHVATSFEADLLSSNYSDVLQQELDRHSLARMSARGARGLQYGQGSLRLDLIILKVAQRSGKESIDERLALYGQIFNLRRQFQGIRGGWRHHQSGRHLPCVILAVDGKAEAKAAARCFKWPDGRDWQHDVKRDEDGKPRAVLFYDTRRSLRVSVEEELADVDPELRRELDVLNHRMAARRRMERRFARSTRNASEAAGWP